MYYFRLSPGDENVIGIRAFETYRSALDPHPPHPQCSVIKKFRAYNQYNALWKIIVHIAPGGTDPGMGYGEMRPWRLLFTPLQFLQESHFKQQSLKVIYKPPPPLKMGDLSFKWSKLAKISALMPSNLTVLVHKTPFQRQFSVCKPHTSEI